jgi:hypothetical protein
MVYCIADTVTKKEKSKLRLKEDENCDVPRETIVVFQGFVGCCFTWNIFIYFISLSKAPVRFNCFTWNNCSVCC